MRHRHPGKYCSRKPKGGHTYKHRPMHKKTYVAYNMPAKLSKEHRSIFQGLDVKPYETGGYMDFNQEGLERADIYIGRKGSVDIDINPDKEIDFHTHSPDKDKSLSKLNQFPSKWDIKAFKDYPSQAMIIFHNNKAVVTTKTNDFKINNKLLERLDRNMNQDAVKLSVNELFKKYKPEYNKMGLKMDYIKHNNSMKIPVNIVEPDKRKQITRRSWFFNNEDPIKKGLTKEGRYLFQREDEDDE